MSEWGNPARLTPRHPRGWEPPELKHLSRARKRKYSASSGERKRKSPNHLLRQVGLEDLAQGSMNASRTVLESQTRAGDSPVDESGQDRAGVPE